MSPAPDLRRWPQADDVLDQALERDPLERDAFLQRAAAGDADFLDALRSVVEEAALEDGFLAPGGALSGTLAAELASAMEDSGRALEPGTAIEHYEIVGMLGRGGMGEVYRARDNKLHRDVALKVLPDHLVRDTHRVARFRREARALASLNHSAIGAIYGIAESGGREALVLELIEGPTLAERLERGPLRPLEAITLARRLAEAIAAAHASGILHRDLKPGNVKIGADGAVKILDFGLAKALDLAPGAPDADLTAQNPSFILGTAPYMSPEQMRAEPVDERSDIWAFGCVLFEMLTGSRAFHGRTPAEVMARVLGGEPAFDALLPATPPPVRNLIRRCLEKDPNLRLRAISDAIPPLEAASTPAPEPARGGWWSWRWVAAGAVLLATGAAPTLVLMRRHPEPPAVSRFALPLPAGDDLAAPGLQPAVAFSRDGRTVVYRAQRNGVVQLFRRSLQQLDAEPVPGSENGAGPFFSPDGRWLAFDSGGVLTRVALGGGPPIVIGSTPGGVTASWMPDDAIVFASAATRVLQRVKSSGGAPETLTTLDEKRGDTLHLLPEALPDGTILFTIVANGRCYVALRLASGETRIVTEGSSARYLPDGFIVFWRAGSLWGMRFDASRKTGGNAVSTDVRVEATDGTVADFAVANDGSLVYLPRADAEPAKQNLPHLVYVQHWVEELKARLGRLTTNE